MGELEKKNIYACALSMPDPNNPIPSEWIKEISRHVERNTKDHIYLVGHSLGVPAILLYLQKTNAKNIKVAEFLKEPFDFKLIQSKVKRIVVIHGDNDKNVSFDQGETLAKELNGKLIKIKNGGHLNGSSGWTTLPICLKELLDMMK